MSWRHGLAAGELPLRQPTQKAVLLALAHHANEYTCRCWPSVERLALFTGLGRRAVQYAIKDLATDGLLIIHERPGKPSIYEITLPGIEPMDQGGAPHAQGSAASAPEDSGRNPDARVLPLEESWQPSDETIAKIKADNVISTQEIERELKSFILKALETGDKFRNPDAAFRRWCNRLPGLKHKLPTPPPPPPPASTTITDNRGAKWFEEQAKVSIIKHDPDRASEEWLKAAKAWDGVPGRDADARRCAGEAVAVARPGSWHQNDAEQWVARRWPTKPKEESK